MQIWFLLSFLFINCVKFIFLTAKLFIVINKTGTRSIIIYPTKTCEFWLKLFTVFRKSTKASGKACAVRANVFHKLNVNVFYTRIFGCYKTSKSFIVQAVNNNKKFQMQKRFCRCSWIYAILFREIVRNKQLWNNSIYSVKRKISSNSQWLTEN